MPERKERLFRLVHHLVFHVAFFLVHLVRHHRLVGHFVFRSRRQDIGLKVRLDGFVFHVLNVDHERSRLIQGRRREGLRRLVETDKTESAHARHTNLQYEMTHFRLHRRGARPDAFALIRRDANFITRLAPDATESATSGVLDPDPASL